MSQHGIVILKKANHALDLLRMSTASAFEGSYSLLDTGEDTQGLLCPNVDPCLKHSVEELEKVHWRTSTEIWGTRPTRRGWGNWAYLFYWRGAYKQWPIARGTKVVDKLSSSLANDKRQYCQVASWEIHVGHQEKKFA